MIDEVVDDYAAYLKVDVKTELEPVEETIEDMLTRLEEFESLMNMVRMSGDVSLSGTIPEMLSRRAELSVLFERVDSLEQLVARVKQNVATVEAQMDLAESQLVSSDSSFKNMFKPLFFKKTDQVTAKSPGAYTTPELFNTDKCFPPQDEEKTDKQK